MSIGSLDDVRPGDIMICGQNAAPAKILVYLGQLLMGQQVRIGRFAAGHAAVVTPGKKLVEAMPNGASERDLRLSDWSPGTIFFRLPEDYDGQHLDAATVAQAMVRTPYSIASYVYIALFLAGFQPKWLANRIDRRRPGTQFTLPSGRLSSNDLPVEEICSVLAEQAWSLSGKKVVHGTHPQVVTPGMLTQQLWEREGIIRFGAGIL